MRLCVLHNRRLQTLGVLDVDSLHIRVQLLLGTLLVVTLTRYPDTEAEWDTLDAGLPDLLVQLRVEADVGCALRGYVSKTQLHNTTVTEVTMRSTLYTTYHSLGRESPDLLDGPRSPLLEAYAMNLRSVRCMALVSSLPSDAGLTQSQQRNISGTLCARARSGHPWTSSN